jgi:polyhydroxyalkanoate synthesis regulator phasin
MSAIIASVITSVLSLVGVIITVVVGGKRQSEKMLAELEKAQAVTDTKLDELTREVREHNNFARRMPALEEKVDGIEKRVARLED